MKNKASYKFLQNIPIGKDLFEGQSQEKIACVLTENIENGEFQIIGIDGGWGTGKSNLVKIVEQKLNETKTDYKFFIYDVWGHQGDDQRKSILIELTDFITKEKQVKDTKKWNENLGKLLAKEREITTLNLPYLSVGFIFSLLSVIYIPTVNVFKDSMTTFFGIEKVFWKLLLVTFPILIVFGIYIWNLGKNWYQKKGFFSSFKFSAQETFQVYTNKQKEETKIETISEKEPSVRDFRAWMNNVDKDLRANKKKLVIVFDNFDRLPKQHIQNIWSSIHIFFSEEKYSNIKVIIPFDRAHIKNAFSELNSSSTNNKNLTDFANDYINKTFDIVFRISPPIMSAWKDFFRTCWSDAFNQAFDESEYIRIEQIYETYAKTITPREIIAFINEVVSIKLIHKDIPEQYIGLFVTNKEYILEDPLKAITEYKFLDGLTYLYKDSDDFQKYITALAYQIDYENALEIIYTKQLKDSLQSNKTELFNEISKTSVFNRIIHSIIKELEDFENPIITLDKIDEDANITPKHKQSIWDDIFRKNQFKPRDIVYVSNGEYILLTRISAKLQEEWIERILNTLTEQTNKFEPIRYADIIDKIDKIITDNNIAIDIYKKLSTQDIKSEDFIRLVKDRKSTYKKYKISTNKTELDSYLSGQDVTYWKDIEHLKFLKVDYPLTNFLKVTRDKISENKTDITILDSLINALKISSKEIIKVDNFFTDADIYTLFNQSNETFDFHYDLIAMRIARNTNFPASYDNLFTTVLNSENETLIKKVSERIEYYINYGNILLNSITNTNILTKFIVQNLTNTRYGTRTANVSLLIKSFKEICSINELNPQVFITTLSDWDSPQFDKKFVEAISNYYIEESTKNECRLAKDTISGINSYFDNLSQEEWKNIFTNLKGELFKRTLIIKYSSWSSFALEALKEVLNELAKSTISDDSDIIMTLLFDFESAGKDLTNTFKNIRDEFINNRNITIEHFNLFGIWLFKYGALEEKSADVMRTIMIANLLDDESCLEELIENQEKVRTLLENASESDSSDFKSALRDRSNNKEIRKFAEELGVYHLKEEKPEEEEEEK